MKRSWLFFFLLGSLLFNGQWVEATNNNNLLRSMATFDKAYIPALALSDGGNYKKSFKAMRILKTTWGVFKQEWNQPPFNDGFWTQDLDEVERLIAEADKELKLEKIRAANLNLANVRLVFRELRTRNQQNYILDYLTDFHQPLELIRSRVYQKTLKRLTSQDLSLIRQNLLRAKRIWSQVRLTNTEARLFNLKPVQVERIKNYINNESEVINDLEAALKANDKAGVIEAGRMLHNNYSRVLVAFGDFERLN